MYRYARMLIEELGFDGFRFDYAKGFGAWMIGLLAKYLYVKDGKDFVPYVVGEYWSGTGDIDGWLDRVEAFTEQPGRGVRFSAPLQAEGRMRHDAL
jgi:alpha-amylase